jgi:multidrug efflux pump
VVYVFWIGLSVVGALMFSMAWKSKELAPMEDQGFILSYVQGAADATIDQTTFYTEEVNRQMMAVPEGVQTFQITMPDSGFGGLVLKPWDERTNSVFQIQGQLAAKFSAIPGIQTFAITPSPLPGGGEFPVEFVILSTEEPGRMLEFARRCNSPPCAATCFSSCRSLTRKLTSPKSNSCSTATRSPRWASTCARWVPTSPRSWAEIS